MKIDAEVLLSKIQAKKNKEGGDYIAISFLDLGSGDNFDLISKEIELMRLKPMTKYNVSLNLSSSKYGLRLELLEVGEELGSI